MARHPFCADAACGDGALQSGASASRPSRRGAQRSPVWRCLQFISAVENRDERKTKHQGFFVNSGGVERIGDKAAPPRKGRKPKAKPATGAAAGSNVGGADRGKAAAAAAAPLLAGSGQAAVAPAAAANRQNSVRLPQLLLRIQADDFVRLDSLAAALRACPMRLPLRHSIHVGSCIYVTSPPFPSLHADPARTRRSLQRALEAPLQHGTSQARVRARSCRCTWQALATAPPRQASMLLLHMPARPCHLPRRGCRCRRETGRQRAQRGWTRLQAGPLTPHARRSLGLPRRSRLRTRRAVRAAHEKRPSLVTTGIPGRLRCRRIHITPSCAARLGDDDDEHHASSGMCMSPLPSTPCVSILRQRAA